MRKGAEFNHDRRYRFRLWRIWDDDIKPTVFIGLNPSTADETEDDPTVRRCIGFAKKWKTGGLIMTNLFAFRATDPKQMKAATDPMHFQNPSKILTAAQGARIVVAAWGVHGRHQDADIRLVQFLKRNDVHLRCLGRTKNGEPRHPLYIAYDKELEPYGEEA
jgi:hypothetical protein